MSDALDLSVVAADYLSTRRALGYQLKQQGQQLEAFIGYLKTLGAEHLTVSDALAWAKLPVDASPVCWHARLGLVRSFARYLQALDPTSEVPPDGLLPGGSHRTTPYIYSQQQIAMLLTAAGRLRSPLRAATYQTLLALLVVTGMRLGEAVSLDRHDLDSEQGLLTIRRGKFGKARQLPLHPSTVKALGVYRDRVDGQHRNVTAPSLFVSTVGTRLIRENVDVAFSRLVHDTELDWSGRRRRPRVHDLRHSFAVRTLVDWYRDGLDVQARLPLLSTYMGHTGPASTYYYLTAVPELVALVADRLDSISQVPS